MGAEQDLAAEKAAQRERFRSVRRRLGEEARATASAAIVAHVLALPDVEAARTVHVFWPLPGEVDTRPLIRALADRGVRVVLPVVRPGPTPALDHRQYLGEGALVAGRWGVREPAPPAPGVDPAALDVVVVPGLAMGRDGSRLGYGGGYYDAFLAQTTALRVGVVWADALVDAVPAGPHDEPLDVVVSEAEVVRVARAPSAPRNPPGPTA